MAKWTFAHSQLVIIAKETASIYSLSLLHTFEAKPRITQVLSNFYEEQWRLFYAMEWNLALYTANFATTLVVSKAELVIF